MSVVRFAPLPPPASRRGPETRASVEWTEAALELRARPNEWGIVKQHVTRSAASAMAHAVKTGRIKAFKPAGSFEAFTQGLDTWVRWVGSADG
jgi:hypothetical protein